MINYNNSYINILYYGIDYFLPRNSSRVSSIISRGRVLDVLVNSQNVRVNIWYLSEHHFIETLNPDFGVNTLAIQLKSLNDTFLILSSG